MAKNRNKKDWNDVTETCNVVCDKADATLSNWKNAQEAKQSIIKPLSGRFKCNVDASFYEGWNRVDIGIYIRDDQGAFVQHMVLINCVLV